MRYFAILLRCRGRLLFTPPLHYIALMLLLLTNDSTIPTLPMGKLMVAAEATTTTSMESFTAEPSTTISPRESTMPNDDDLDRDSSLAFWSVLLIRKTFQITCCMDATPIVNEKLVHNFTYQFVSYVVVDERSDSYDAESGTDGASPTTVAPSAALSCRSFRGSYMVPPPGLFHREFGYAVDVRCKCPERAAGRPWPLDRSCRRLPTCKNNGFRSLIDPRKCLCLQPYFGDRCEKHCEQGQRHRGLDGHDYCSCTPFYRGEECSELVCLNGGREEAGRCICPPQFVGFHCELDTNHTSLHDYALTYGAAGGSGGGSRFHHSSHSRFGGDGGPSGEMFTRDLSGTIFSLVMIVVLVVSMYLLMKHRMQVQSRYLSRRSDLLAACQFPTFATSAGGPASARRVELMTHPHSHHGATLVDERILPFSRAPHIASFGDGGPPPYVPPGQHRGSAIATAGGGRRARRENSESLPPLPTYEDATKLPALVTGGGVTSPPDSDDPPAIDPRTPAAESERDEEVEMRDPLRRHPSQMPFIERVGEMRGTPEEPVSVTSTDVAAAEEEAYETERQHEGINSPRGGSPQ